MIQGIDIKDWVCVGQPTKLFRVARESMCSFTEEPEVLFKFHHTDGMYSLCSDIQGSVFHPAAWSDVFVWKRKVGSDA